MELIEDWKEFINLLNERKVKYLLVGGFAVSSHGYVRGTVDIDFWIEKEKQNAEILLKIIDEFGFGFLNFTLRDLMQDEMILQLGAEPYRIDVMCSIDGVEFGSCWERRIDGVIDGIHVNLISLTDLRKNKESTGRGKDKIDLENLPPL